MSMYQNLTNACCVQSLNRALLGCLAAVAVYAASCAALVAAPPADSPDLKRARREVQLLDDMYKTAIVLITEHYVDDSSDMPAGVAFKALFEGMQKKGWHEVRLLDASGEPINEENAPRDDFEKRAVASLLAGKPYVDEVTTRDGKSYLRAATPIPVVMEKCIMCHENYRGKKVIGSLGFTLPLDVNAQP
jgi:hypothetical protein